MSPVITRHHERSSVKPINSVGNARPTRVMLLLCNIHRLHVASSVGTQNAFPVRVHNNRSTSRLSMTTCPRRRGWLG
eukprot:12070967-Alexandrium_andersonii.AAC.1